MAVTDNDVMCNFKKCRQRLISIAWVTSCSHIFCEEDGTREFQKSFVCPACNTSLEGKYDIVKIDLQPSEQYKSMMLAGLKPETVMEIASRAIAFWTYQSYQEKVFHEYACEKAKDSRAKLEQYYEQLVAKLHAELKAVKNEISTKNKDLSELRKRLNEVSEQHLEKNRQYQKLQIMYDSLRRRTINPAAVVDEGSTKSLQDFGALKSQHLRHLEQFVSGSVRNIPSLLFCQGEPSRAKTTSPNRGEAGAFNLQPFPTPQQTDAPHENDRIGTRFTLHLQTPYN